MSPGLERVRERAKAKKKERFTALLHHVTVDLLKDAFSWLKRDAAPGVDGRTWQSTSRTWKPTLSICMHAFIAAPIGRCPHDGKFIPKADGRQRPLGIAALEDKIVQRAVVEVLNAIYEEDFLGFSYGFRPGRGQHDALDALAVGITHTKVNWIVDADIAGFFDTVSHEWLIRFVEHRIGDPRMIRLIRKWLKAGVMDDGELGATVRPARPQGAVVSPTARQHLPPLRLRPLGRAMAKAPCPRSSHHRALRRRHRHGLSSTKVKPNASWQICGSGWRSSRYRCIRTRHA